MSDTDQIPDTFLNKTQIAEEYGMSRVTVNKHLKTLESSGRLIPKTVQQGNRKLYYYDPEDVKVAFSTLRSASNNVRNVQSRVVNSRSVSQSTDIELLKKDLETERRISSEKDRNIANLEKRVEELREDVNYFKAQLTDQRPSATTPAPAPIHEAPKPTPVAPETKALPTELDRDHPDNVVSLPTAKVEKAIKEAEQEVREDIDDATLEDVMEHFDPMNSAELALLDEEIEANKKAKDISPEPQSNPSEEADKQSPEEATAKEERRNNITSKPEPAPVKRSLWQKLKDNW